MEDFIRDWWTRNEGQVLAWRRHLHAHPELSHMEHSTTQFVADKLRAAGLEPVMFPNTGLMVDIGDASGNSGAAGERVGRLAFRGDMDALPITEATGLSYSSVNEGVMHACGHDFHTVITLATAIAMAEYQREHTLPVPLRFIFQPAEEVMVGGAPDVIEFGALDGVERIFAVHCEPKLRVGHVGVRVGAITSASDTLDIHVEGPGGHSSRPHLTTDVVYALGKLVTDLPGLLSRRVDPRTGTVLVFGAINAGYAPNAIPAEGRLRGTIRTADIKTWRAIDPLLRELIDEVLAPPTGSTTSVACRRCSTTITAPPWSPRPSAASTRTPSSRHRSRRAARTSAGTSSTCRGPWRAWAAGRGAGRSMICTATTSSSTNAASASACGSSAASSPATRTETPTVRAR